MKNYTIEKIDENRNHNFYVYEDNCMEIEIETFLNSNNMWTTKFVENNDMNLDLEESEEYYSENIAIKEFCDRLHDHTSNFSDNNYYILDDDDFCTILYSGSSVKKLIKEYYKYNCNKDLETLNKKMTYYSRDICLNFNEEGIIEGKNIFPDDYTYNGSWMAAESNYFNFLSPNLYGSEDIVNE
jgi:hypothetical protein